MAIDIRTLQHEDAEALLAFELKNRHWFEQHIDARPAAFYSIDGVRDHIGAYLDSYARSAWHPCLLLEEGTIIGRANLKDIDTAAGVAEIGYRVAQEATGRGAASSALQHLVELARSRWRLRQLFAQVIDGNAASARVLVKNGFVPVKREVETALVMGERRHLTRYTLKLL
jgi:ribosomal-protein-alanine N-acetyltransferase